MRHHLRVLGVTGLLFGVGLAQASCASSETPAGGSSSSSSTSSSGGSSGTTSSGGTDGGSSNDATVDATVDATTDAAAGCQAGGLTPPAAGKTIMEITFSDAQGGYNGATTYTPPVNAGVGAVSDPSQWYLNVTGSASVRLVFEANPTPCKAYTPMAAPSAGAPSIQLSDPTGKKQWWCGGTMVVDSIKGKEIQFHFDATTCVAPSFGGQEGTGTVKMSGKGASTFF